MEPLLNVGFDAWPDIISSIEALDGTYHRM